MSRENIICDPFGNPVVVAQNERKNTKIAKFHCLDNQIKPKLKTIEKFKADLTRAFDKLCENDNKYFDKKRFYNDIIDKLMQLYEFEFDKFISAVTVFGYDNDPSFKYLDKRRLVDVYIFEGVCSKGTREIYDEIDEERHMSCEELFLFRFVNSIKKEFITFSNIYILKISKYKR